MALRKEELMEQIQGYGVDSAPESRPGVPMETEPRPSPDAHWAQPERQKATVKVFKRVGLEELTPVFGTAQPPHGLSGLLRGLAYRIPESKAQHWAMLLFADRVDVIESAIGEFIGKNKAASAGVAAGSALLAVAFVASRSRRSVRQDSQWRNAS